VLSRLVRAADLALQRDGIEGVSIDAVAAAAGVSRATAFRQLGKRDEMIVAVAISRSRRLVVECAVLMSRPVGAFAQLEAAFVYLVRELSNDPIVRELFALRTSDNLGPGTRDMAVAIFGSAVADGRTTGEIRTDVSDDQIIDWTVEQLYLAVRQVDRSDTAVLQRVRTFLAPALAADRDRLISGNVLSRVESLETALDRAKQALSALQAELQPAADV
jgi:AcrR family transcriptional regulator